MSEYLIRRNSRLVRRCAWLLTMAGAACADVADEPSRGLRDVSALQQGAEPVTPPPCSPPGAGSPEDVGCEVDGVRHAVGDTFYDALRCNTCTCGADGATPCTTRTCDPAEACTLGDHTFAKGTALVCADGCNSCRCEAGGWLTTYRLCEPLRKIEPCGDAPESHVKIDVLYRKGDTLALELSSAGCEDEPPVFELCWDELAAEGLPPKVRVRALKQEVASCSSRLTQQEVFDLAPLRERLDAAPADQQADIRVLIGGDEVSHPF